MTIGISERLANRRGSWFPARAVRRRTLIAVFIAALNGSALGSDDPFAGLDDAPPATGMAPERAVADWTENLLFRKEIYALFGAARDDYRDTGRTMSRISAGFEILKKVSTATRTVASFDYQGRMVYRDHPLATSADPMGRDASAWEYETHNAYADLYQLWGEPGRFNARIGSFYPPFGLNQQTDTHGTLLQLSNDQVFGTDRDWQAALYGYLNESLDYTIGYLLGGGPHGRMSGQAGMGVARLAWNAQKLYQDALEGGVSFAAGERVDAEAVMRSPSVARATRGDPVVATWRLGADIRRRVDTASGPVTFTLETAVGHDESDPLVSGLAQADWLHPSRRFAAALQFRELWQDIGAGGDNLNDARMIGVLTYYLRNDVGNTARHGISLAIEHPLHDDGSDGDPMVLVQYYRYW